MRVSREEIMKVARLAKLKINEEDIQRYQESLEDLLEFVDVVNNSYEPIADSMQHETNIEPLECATWLEEKTFLEDRDSNNI